MALYQYTTTPMREAALSAAVAAANAALPPGQAPWTNAAYWAARNDEVLDSYGRVHQAGIAARAVGAFAAAPAAAQADLLALLGLSDYAGLPPQALAPVLATLGLANFQALTPDRQAEAFVLAGLAG